jgi:hypothetical protein
VSDRLSPIEARLGLIEQALDDVRRRIDALESRGASHADTAEGAPAAAQAPLPLAQASRPDVSSLVSLVGRTFVVLGGAYLLRALTESGRLPGRGGIVLGLAYAVGWFGAADRASPTRPLSGLFHGLAALVISLPLLWEASAHFGLFSPALTAATLALITSVALGVAWHRRLQSLAAIAVLGSICVSIPLVVVTSRPLPFAAGLVALGAATLWLHDARGWSWLRWPAALAADLVALGLIARSAVVPPLEPRGAVIALLLSLLITYVGSAAWRAFVEHEPLQGAEMAQTASALGIGLLGALTIARGVPGVAQPALASLALAGAAVGYAAAFGLLRRPGAHANFVFFTTLAFALLLIGGGAIVSGPAQLAWCGALALAAAAAAARTAEPQLSLHATGLTLAMAGASGMLSWSATVWFATMAGAPWSPAFPAHLATIVVAAACLAIPPPAGPAAAAPALAVVSRFGLAILLVAGSGGMLVRWLGPLVAGDALDAGVLASMSTAVLAGSALVVALCARIKSRVEFRWLVYPVLAAGGLKLVADDFRHSTPATLFAALAMYGAALILAPRIARRPSG